MPDDDSVADDETGGTDPDGPLARIEAMETERWAEAVVTGAVVYVVGYLLMAALFFIGPANPGEDLALSDQLGVVGVTYSAAHNVAVQTAYDVLVITDGEAVVLGRQFGLFEFFGTVGGEQSIPTGVYLALPVVLLLTVGFSRAWRLSPTEDVWEPVKTTFGLPVGYGALAYLGSYLYSYPVGTFDSVANIAIIYVVAPTRATQGNLTSIFVPNSSDVVELEGVYREAGATLVLSPDPGGALLFGLVYPLVFATVGALLAVSLRQVGGEEAEDAGES